MAKEKAKTEKKETKKATKKIGVDMFDKAELKAMAKDVFKNVKASVLYASNDGQFFFKESDARLTLVEKVLRRL